MFLVPLLQFAVCFLILVWLLKKKPGERYSKKAAARFVRFGALSAVVFMILGLFPLTGTPFSV